MYRVHCKPCSLCVAVGYLAQLLLTCCDLSLVSAAKHGGVRSTRSVSASPDGSPVAVSAEEDARAQRVAEAAATLLPGSSVRPALEFDGIKPNSVDMDELESMENEEESAMDSRMSSLQKAMDEYYSKSLHAGPAADDARCCSV